MKLWETTSLRQDFGVRVRTPKRSMLIHSHFPFFGGFPAIPTLRKLEAACAHDGKLAEGNYRYTRYKFSITLPNDVHW